MPDKFNELLLQYSQELRARDRKKIEKEIWTNYGTEKAILVVDMSGFSLLTERFGIVHYLSMVRRMQMTSKPIVESFKGTVVKYEADNCFALFDNPLNAIRASISLNFAFDAENILTPDELDIRISSGIDYGRVLIVAGKDFFGNAVNHASKLGEDLAKPGEILVTSKAMKLVPSEAGITFENAEYNISNIKLRCCSVAYRKSEEA